MSVTINPRSQGGQLGERLAAKASVASTPGPRTGYAWGLLLARMEERVLPPGGVERTKLCWVRREAHSNTDPCNAKGPVLICGRCWDTDHIFAGLTILGPLTASVGVRCDRCQGIDSEVQGYGADPEALTRIAEWNAMLDRRRKDV